VTVRHAAREPVVAARRLGWGMTSDPQEALTVRIEQFRTTGNAAVLLDEQALTEAAALRTSMGWPASGPLPPAADIRGGLDEAVTVGTFRWLRSQLLPQADRLDDLLEAAELLTAARKIAPRSVPRPTARMLAAVSGQGRGRGLNHASVHDEAIEVLSTAARSGGELAGIDHAIMLLSAAARSAEGHRHQPYYLSDLGVAWLDRFAITGRPRDLDNSVTAHAGAVGALEPEPEDRAGLLANYSAARLAQFRQSGDSAHLQDAVAAARTAADLARTAAAQLGAAAPEAAPPAVAIPGPAGERAAAIRLARLASLSQLEAGLRTSYERGGSDADLDAAVQVAREAASLVPPGDPAHPRYQARLDFLLGLPAAHRMGPCPAESGTDTASAAPARPEPAARPEPPEEPWRRTLAAG
jgi:hypothetical protein